MVYSHIPFNQLGIQLIDRITNSWLYEKCSSILLSTAVMRERLACARDVNEG